MASGMKTSQESGKVLGSPAGPLSLPKRIELPDGRNIALRILAEAEGERDRFAEEEAKIKALWEEGG